MKCTAVAMAVYIAFASQAFAVLRPLFPAKAGPPFGVEAIVKGYGSVSPLVKRAPTPCGDSRCISCDTQAIGLRDRNFLGYDSEFHSSSEKPPAFLELEAVIASRSFYFRSVASAETS